MSLANQYFNGCCDSWLRWVCCGSWGVTGWKPMSTLLRCPHSVHVVAPHTEQPLQSCSQVKPGHFHEFLKWPGQDIKKRTCPGKRRCFTTLGKGHQAGRTSVLLVTNEQLAVLCLIALYQLVHTATCHNQWSVIIHLSSFLILLC